MTDALNYQELTGEGTAPKKKPYARYDEVRIPLPNRFLVVGSSGSGKTVLLRNALRHMNAWSRFLLFVKQPDEPLYESLIDMLREVEAKTGQDILTVSSDLEELPELDDIDERYPTVLILDDMVLEDKRAQAKMAAYFIRGRKKNVSAFYLSQSYFNTLKLIRQNADVLLLKKLTQRDLRLVLSEFAVDLDMAQLLELYRSSGAATDIRRWLTIDSSPGQPAELRYRHNWTPVGPSESD